METKYILTIGLNDKDTKMQKYETITAYKMVESITQQYVDGYTIYETRGGYKHDDGTYTFENSLRLELMFTNELQVRLIAEAIKKQLNQESIALETLTTNTKLI
jgi:hypothetical protein